MRKYNVAFGENRKAKKWNNGTITWDELRERLRTPLRTAETQEEYHHMKSAGRSAAKDKGGFVAGTLRDGLRRAANVESRSMLTLDVDNASKTFLEEYDVGGSTAGCAYFARSAVERYGGLHILHLHAGDGGDACACRDIHHKFSQFMRELHFDSIRSP